MRVINQQLTDEQIIEHLAKVMGWHIKSNSHWAWYYGDQGQAIIPTFRWRPLTEDRDARQVADVMLEKGWDFNLHQFGKGAEFKGAEARFSHYKVRQTRFGPHTNLSSGRHYKVKDPSGARAISMAAYEATKEA